jgi:hypothetical protein
MRFQQIDFQQTKNDGQEHKVSIIISGDKPELMINERLGDEFETVQVHREATHALYLALHKIYSAKP